MTLPLSVTQRLLNPGMSGRTCTHPLDDDDDRWTRRQNAEEEEDDDEEEEEEEDESRDRCPCIVLRLLSCIRKQ